MLHDALVLGWVIGFASATVLAISIAIYKSYAEQLQRYNNNDRYDIDSKE
jgi:hypothetical protein